MMIGPARRNDGGRAELLFRRVRPGRRARVRGGHALGSRAPTGVHVLRFWQVSTNHVIKLQ